MSFWYVPEPTPSEKLAIASILLTPMLFFKQSSNFSSVFVTTDRAKAYY